MQESPPLTDTGTADRRADEARTAGDPPRVAVVGAGLSGLACARTLHDAGSHVRVFEKARGPGGRASTRRAGRWRFDHGAQYFTVRDETFERWVARAEARGVVARWEGAVVVLEDGRQRATRGVTDRLVGVPGMNALCRELADGLSVRLETQVRQVEPAAQGWRVTADDGLELGRFDAVVVSAPAPQTAALLATTSPVIAEAAAAVEMTPCWSVMVGFEQPLGLGFDAAFVHGSPLGWVARNTSKPGRPGDEAWVLHATGEWSGAHLEVEPPRAARLLLEAFGAAVGGPTAAPVHLDAHRWRFAQPTEPLADRCLVEAGTGLVACGDWCAGPRVEGALLSGLAAADAVVEALRVGHGGAGSPVGKPGGHGRAT